MDYLEKKTQQEEIIEHLLKHGSITRLEAACDHHIFELASRIGELKKKGYKIKSERIYARNKYNKKTHFSKYTLEV